MNNDLAAALTALISSAAPAVAAPTTIEQDFAELLAGTSPAPAPAHPVRCPVTGGVWMFARTAEEAEALTARLAA